jgi:hypothetical protein
LNAGNAASPEPPCNQPWTSGPSPALPARRAGRGSRTHSEGAGPHPEAFSRCHARLKRPCSTGRARTARWRSARAVLPEHPPPLALVAAVQCLRTVPHSPQPPSTTVPSLPGRSDARPKAAAASLPERRRPPFPGRSSPPAAPKIKPLAPLGPSPALPRPNPGEVRRNLASPRRPVRPGTTLRIWSSFRGPPCNW